MQFYTVKQAADLHSNFLCQKILNKYLTTHDIDEHIRDIVKEYKKEVPCDVQTPRRSATAGEAHHITRWDVPDGHPPKRSAVNNRFLKKGSGEESPYFQACLFISAVEEPIPPE